MTDLATYVLERNFDAPRDLVWRTFTEPGLVARWYGPNVETIVHQMDVRPGGAWLVEMKWGDNSMYQRADYTQVDAPGRLVWLNSMTDGDWQVISNPRMPDWPRVLMTTVTLEAAGDKTRMRLTWVPHEATHAEINCFAGAMGGLDSGWGSGMDLLAELLAELQA